MVSTHQPWSMGIIEPKLFMETGTSRITEGCVYRVPCTGRDGSIAGQEIPFRGYSPEALDGRKEGGRYWLPKGAAKSVAAAQRPPATASCTVIWQAGMVVVLPHFRRLLLEVGTCLPLGVRRTRANVSADSYEYRVKRPVLVAPLMSLPAPDIPISGTEVRTSGRAWHVEMSTGPRLNMVDGGAGKDLFLE